jgi:hypothetical protein
LRADLFYVTFNLPAAVSGGGSNLWNSEIGFAVEKFPFPERSREMIGIKYLNQTNFVLGADTPTPPVEVAVRWAFNRSTVTLLEQWHQLTSNSLTGGVAITSEIKTKGLVIHMIPNPAAQANPGDSTQGAALQDGPGWAIEGVLVKGLKPAPDLDMTAGNAVVGVALTLQYDRYYALQGDPTNLAVLNV